ncbi:MAG: hypothetical protein AB1540_06115 [Bdellovibrionota bacterium]
MTTRPLSAIFKRGFLIAFFTLLLLSTAHAQHKVFEGLAEFPNYFLSKEFRALSLDEIERLPTAARTRYENEVKQVREQLAKTLTSIFNRVTVPLVPIGSNKPKMLRYFPYLTGELRKIDPTVKVMPSGGVVRAALSYLYKELYDRNERGIEVNLIEFLKQIEKDSKDLPGIEIRGVGSDFDILVETASGMLDKVKGKATNITNSAEEAYEFVNERGGLKRSLFVIGDVKEYGAQTDLSTRQGGSTLDFLAFDLEGGNFVEPQKYRTIIDDFIKGFYSYEAPHDIVLDAPKQTIRGGRPLLELPFLRIKDDAVLKGELVDLLKKIESGEEISHKAIEQFDKMVRNARYSGARNRMYRAKPGSIDELFFKVAMGLSKKVGRVLLPEFVDQNPIRLRSFKKSELNGLPASLLTPVDEFVKEFTKDGSGTVYHGTPSTENGIAILRQGIFISKTGQGTSAYHRGAYSSPDLSVAQSYGRGDGIVFELKIKNDKRVNILDWEKAKDDLWMKALIAEKGGNIDHVFETLARKHGIDVIINHHVLIQNADAFEIHGGLGSLINAYRLAAMNKTGSIKARLSAFRSFQKLRQYTFALGEDVADIPIEGLLEEVVAQRKGFKELFEGLLDEDFSFARQSIRQSKKLKSLLRTGIVAVWPLPYLQIENFPWDIDDPEDVALLKKIDQRYPRNSAPPIKAIRSQLVGLEGLRENNIAPEMITDPELREDFKRARSLSTRRDYLEQALKKMFEQDPVRFLELFPGKDEEYKLPDAMGVELLKKIAKKSRKKLTHKDLVLIDHLTRRGYRTTVVDLLTARKEARDQTIASLKSSRKQGTRTVIEILGLLSQYPKDRTYQEASENLIRELKSDPKWRAEIRDWFLDQGDLFEGSIYSGAQGWKRFPWDLSDANDVRVLREALSNREQKKRRYLDVLLELRQKEGHSFSISEGEPHKTVSTDLIYNPKLKEEYIEAKADYVTSGSQGRKGWVDQVLEHLSQTQPKKYQEHFSEGKKALFESHRWNYWTEIVRKFNEHGEKALNAEERKVFRELLNRPLVQADYSLYHLLVVSDGRAREKILNRVKSFSAHDQVDVILFLLDDDKAKKVVFAALKRTKSFSEIKKSMRLQLKQKLDANIADDSTAYSKFPWDMNDLEDVAFVKHAQKKYSTPSERSLDAVAVQIKSRQSEFFGVQPKQMPPEKVIDRTLREQLVLAQRQHKVSNQVNAILKQFSEQDLNQFIREFPSTALKVEVLPSFSAPLLAKSKKGSRAKITQEDLNLIDYLVRNEDTSSLIHFLNGRPEIQNHVLRSLKEFGQNGVKIAIRILSGNNEIKGVEARVAFENSAIQRLVRALKEDQEWRAQVRFYFFSQGDTWDHEFQLSNQFQGWKNFPWNLNDPNDLEVLRVASSDREEKRKRYIEVLGELKEKEGLPFDLHFEHPSRTPNPKEVYDPGLKRRYIRAKIEYYLSQSSESEGVAGRILQHLAAKHPKEYKRHFGFQHKPISRDTYNWKWWESLIQKLNEGTEKALSKDELKVLQSLVKQPLRYDTAQIYELLIKEGGRAQKLALQRLERFSDPDDVKLVLYLLRGGMAKGSASETVELALKNSKRYPEIKSRMRKRLYAVTEIEQRYDWNDFREFPWDVNDPQDVKFLKEVSSRFSEVPPRSLETISHRIGVLQPEVAPMGPQYIAPEVVIDPVLREELRREQRRERVLSRVGGALNKMLFQDPDRFIELFPIPESTRGLPVERYQIFFEKIKKQNADPLNSHDLALADYLVRRQEISSIASLLTSREEIRDQALKSLKTLKGDALAVIIEILGETKVSNDEARAVLFKALNGDKAWRAEIRDAFFTKADPWRLERRFQEEVSGWKNFPWDLDDPDDVEVLTEANLDGAKKERRYLDVLAEMKQREGHSFTINEDGVPYKTAELEHVYDLDLRERYRRAKAEYYLARVGEKKGVAARVLDHLAQSQPEKYKRGFSVGRRAGKGCVERVNINLISRGRL